MDPLVVLPGFMQDARSFMPQIVELGKDRQIVLPRLVGETVEQMSLSAIPDLPRRFALIGHGLGGDVAFDILRRLPEAVTRIALVSTDALPEPPAIAARREARLVSARAGRLAEALAEDVPPAAVAPNDWKDDVLALMQDMGLGLGLEAYIRQTRVLQRRPDQQRTLRKHRVPAVIIAGRADTLLPLRRQEFLAELMPLGRLSVVEEAGHMPQLEQPETVNEVLQEFLAGPMVLR